MVRTEVGGSTPEPDLRASAAGVDRVDLVAHPGELVALVGPSGAAAAGRLRHGARRGGVKLSSGQRQRLSIARAFLEDARVLILTVRDADRIAVMARGRIVADGRHDELIAKSPLYRQLATQLSGVELLVHAAV